MDELIKIRYESDGVCWVEMRDVKGKNALTPNFVNALEKAFTEADNNDLTKVIVLSGMPDVFCSGASADTLQSIACGEIVPTEITLPRTIFSLRVPVIAAAQGSAIGGGFALALAADLLVIAEQSRYGANFITMGFTPGMGTTKLLEYCLSPAIAHELLYTGELRKGKKYMNTGGGINAIVPAEKVHFTALQMALRITEHNPHAIKILKRALTLPRRTAFETSLTLESLMHEQTFRDYNPEAMISNTLGSSKKGKSQNKGSI